MKNIIKVLGIIALTAIIGFGLTACPSPDGGGTGGEKERVEPPVSIEITTQPTKVKYNIGSDIDLSGMVLKATYKDGTEKEIDIKDIKVSGYDKNKKGNQTVTVTYGGKSVTFYVNVIDPDLETVETPTADPVAGTYSGTLTVTLSTETEDAVIYYTLDGTEPTVSSTVYNSSFLISHSSLLKAFAVKENMNDSDILTAEYTFTFAAVPGLTLVPDNGKITYIFTASNPAAETYDVFWKEGSGLSAAEVKTGTQIAGAASGGTITGLTNGTAYSVIVTANKQGYESVDSAVQTATPGFVYIITGSGTTFTATRNGAAFGTADQPIQDVINAIRSDAAGAACTIQFGNGTNVLNIGTASVSFNNSGGTWGALTLTGKITANVSNTSSGTISISSPVSVTSGADITNTNTNDSANAVYSRGALAITGGTVSAAGMSPAVYNNSTGAVTISGGTVSATGSNGYAVSNASTGAVSISGGTVSATGWNGRAVYNASTGKITVSQAAGATTLVTSANTDAAQGTIYLRDSGSGTAARLEITGGTVENTSATTGNAIRNDSTGAVTISGGTVSKAGSGTNANYAIYNNSTGTVTITAPPAVITGNNYGVTP